jgi:hypothetical protein
MEKQNTKLIQLLEIRDNTIRAVAQNASDLDQPLLGFISKDKWVALSKENLSDPTSRRLAIDKYIFQ